MPPILLINNHDPQFPADLVTFAEEILNRKLHFLCSVTETGMSFEIDALFEGNFLIALIISFLETG